MKMSNKETGKRGEDIAALYLKKRGYRLTDRNYRCPLGEIDIVARDGEDVVFVEVKSRKSLDFGEPEAAVNRKKQIKLSKIALTYINENDIDNRNARFDVVAVVFSGKDTQLRHIKNAFDLIYG
jgi:putative endonuclease